MLFTCHRTSTNLKMHHSLNDKQISVYYSSNDKRLIFTYSLIIERIKNKKLLNICLNVNNDPFLNNTSNISWITNISLKSFPLDASSFLWRNCKRVVKLELIVEMPHNLYNNCYEKSIERTGEEGIIFNSILYLLP